MAAAFEHAHAARTALHAIASDPAHGPDALLNPQAIASLLSDFLPDAPRESGLLIAAVGKDVPSNLRQHAAQGLDASTAIRLAASSFAAASAYSAGACQWAAGELALAMGLAGPGDLAALDDRPAEAGDLAAEAADLAAEAGDRPAEAGDVPAEPVTRPQEALAPVTGPLAMPAPDTRPQQPPPVWPDVPAPARRRRPSAFAVAAAVIAVAAVASAGTALVISHLSATSSGPPAAGSHAGRHGSTSPSVPASSPAGLTSSPAGSAASVPSPPTVVRAYIAAVNRRDWPRVWQLGGKNLGESYHNLVAGYRLTKRVVITSLTTSGNAVDVRVLAYETTGAVQTYALSYLVSDGVIVAGQSTLIGSGG